jgi:sialate O-acetylesterase
LAHPWARASPANVGFGADVMGGTSGGFSATCWYFGMELNKKVGVPIGLVHSSYGGSAVEDWISKETLGDGKSGPCPGPIVHSMGLPSQQYNGQLRPLVNMTIKGAVWYQGESNGGQNQLYSCRYEQMMTEWRALWHQGTGGATDPNFPVGFVQIGPYGQAAGRGGNSEKCFAIRVGQTGGAFHAPSKRWPHSFMSTGFDLMNPPGTHCMAGCIHIFNKQAVGHRLALGARATVYNEPELVFSGPQVVSVAAAGPGKVTITYGTGTEGGGLKLRSGYGFEACAHGCGDGFSANPFHSPDGFANATVVASTKTSVTIEAPELDGAAILTVRYAFDDAPSQFFTPSTQPAVYNAEGIPAYPGVWNITAA